MEKAYSRETLYKKAFELTLEDLEHTVNIFDIMLSELNSNKSHIELMREYYLDKARGELKK